MLTPVQYHLQFHANYPPLVSQSQCEFFLTVLIRSLKNSKKEHRNYVLFRIVENEDSAFFFF